MKFFILSYFFVSAFSFAKSDRAYLRVSEKVYFENEVLEFSNELKKIECLFGSTVQKTLLDKQNFNVDAQIIFRLKLLFYVTEIKFKIEESALQNLLGNQLNSCGVLDTKGRLVDKYRNLIFSELYVQEYLLGAKDDSNKIVFFNRLKKLLNKRYEHFLFTK